MKITGKFGKTDELFLFFFQNKNIRFESCWIFSCLFFLKLGFPREWFFNHWKSFRLQTWHFLKRIITSIFFILNHKYSQINKWQNNFGSFVEKITLGKIFCWEHEKIITLFLLIFCFAFWKTKFFKLFPYENSLIYLALFSVFNGVL